MSNPEIGLDEAAGLMAAHIEDYENQSEEEKNAAFRANDLEKRACLSNWFPKLFRAGLPMPLTVWLEADLDLSMLREESLKEVSASVADEVEEAIAFSSLDYPVFLRTGQTSGKHEWNDTCYLESSSRVWAQVRQLMYGSLTAGFKPKPVNVWAAREYLDLKSSFTAFGGMPVAREFRYFVEDGVVEHSQPYWPASALDGYVDDGLEKSEWMGRLYRLNKFPFDSRPRDLAKRASEELEGSWSVDVAQEAETDRWLVIDCAPAEASYRWSPEPGRPHIRNNAAILSPEDLENS